MENKKEALELMRRYETIKLKEIKESWRKGLNVNPAQELTGFGNQSTCTLCRAMPGEYGCGYCFWYDMSPGHCNAIGISGETYCNIRLASTPIELYHAYRARARYMRKVYKEWRKNESTN